MSLEVSVLTQTACAASFYSSIAQRFGLKSISYGKDENRQLVVCRKKTPWQIVQEVQDAGGSTDKYDLIPPENN